jgi:O-methyltransferase
VQTFRPFPGVQLVRGVVPDTLSQVTADAICYLSLDMNNAAPEIAAAEHFWDRLVSGGIIVLDDYGWSKQINQKIAFDSFAETRNVRVLSLPTGQGFADQTLTFG